MSRRPLVVDLDGTLILTDMLLESALDVARDAPWKMASVPAWLMGGKANLKRNLASLSTFDPALLPYNEKFVAWLRMQKSQGRHLVLCTASDESIAVAIAAHLDIFDEVVASDGLVNLAGPYKAAALTERYGVAGFDYAGDARADLRVWEASHGAIVVNASDAVANEAEACCPVEQVFLPAPFGPRIWLKVLRTHQWVKNLLLFVPLFAAHQLSDARAWWSVGLAFGCFCVCASSVYIANDLLDLSSDRQHVRKRMRPFALGAVPLWIGIVLAPVLLTCSLIGATFVGSRFLPWLIAYFVLTCAYSLALKRKVLVDCLTLAMLYTLRIVAGAAAASTPLSFWLLAFSVFLFLSLAFVKRYAELEIQLLSGKQKVHGRGYFTTDAPLVQSLGVTAGYASVLVLALYLNSEAVVLLYKTPQLVWGTVPVMLFWISWMWMRAHRGEMHDDPLVFAVRDRASLLAGIAFALVLVSGSIDWGG